MHNKKVEVEYFEGNRAERYDNFIPLVIPTYNQLLEYLPKMARAQQPYGQRAKLLIAGCGTGNEVVAFAKESAAWDITACDPSPAMIDIATKKLCEYPNVHLVASTVADIPSQEKFDAATLILVLHFLTDDGAKAELLKSIAHRLKDGAPFFLVDICGTEKEIADNLPILRALLPMEWSSEKIEEVLHNIQHNIHYTSEPRLEELLAEAGFENRVRFHQATVYKAWKAIKATAPQAVAMGFAEILLAEEGNAVDTAGCGAIAKLTPVPR